MNSTSYTVVVLKYLKTKVGTRHKTCNAPPVWFCFVPFPSLFVCLRCTHKHTEAHFGKRVHKLPNTTGRHIFMAVLSGVTTVHIHLFGISMIDVFFMLPFGLKQYAVQSLCMLMCPLTPAVSNYPWGMEPRLGLQPPAIIWVMAKLHKSFCRKLKKEKKERRNHSRGSWRGHETRGRKRKERRRERGSVRKGAMRGFHCFALKFLSPHVYNVLIFPLWATFTAEAINFGVR